MTLMEKASIAFLGPMFASHETVNHSIGEYVRGRAHTNTLESYFAILKRGINGVYHHVSETHLKQYLGEFDFRYNERSMLGVEDVERSTKAVKGVVGRRMTYKNLKADKLMTLPSSLEPMASRSADSATLRG